jgi:hypothetical protein
MRHRGWMAAAVTLGLTTVGLAGQATPPGGSAATENIEADPIRCWWRTSASAVRAGEPFTLVLTCAIVDNESTSVVPDQSRLEPSAMQLPPFEVIGGQRGPDLHSDQRRFFQYQYKLRIINEELFGKDAHIPSIQVNYHIETKVARGEAVRGRDRTYLLPTQSVRVLSLVPIDASDIRDTPSWTFDDIEAQRFRARVFYVVGGVLFAAAALVTFAALVRFVRKYREEGAVGRALVSNGAILRAARRELAAVGRSSAQDRWSHELAGRAAAVFRIAGSMALSQRIGQTAMTGDAPRLDGQLFMRGGLLRGRKVLVSGSATASAIARELVKSNGSAGARHQQCLEQLQTGLTRFTAAQFGREDKLDDVALTESVREGLSAIGRLTFENRWVVRKLKDATNLAVELGNRAWSR